MSETGKRLEQLGITLSVRDRKGKGMAGAVQVGGSLFISAHFLTDTDGKAVHMGKVGADIDKETAYQAARLCGLSILATIKDYIGELDRVDYMVKILGPVNSTKDFSEQPAVMNGFFDLMVEVFEKRGQHARSAMGAYALKQDIPVTMETIVRTRR